jgi:hypothetical protein
MSSRKNSVEGGPVSSPKAAAHPVIYRCRVDCMVSLAQHGIDMALTRALQ